MKRNETTTLDKLKENDRFHKLDDKKKTVYQVMQQPEPPLTYFIICLPGTIASNPMVKETNYGRHLINIGNTVRVVFLRNLNEV